jgi:DNA-binding NtrC family response regulator
MRIAVLDDDPSPLQCVTEALTPIGHHCQVSSGGRLQIVHRLQRETFELVTQEVDVVGMPVDAVLAWTRQNCDARLPALLMTNGAHDADLVYALNASVFDTATVALGSQYRASVATDAGFRNTDDDARSPGSKPHFSGPEADTYFVRAPQMM